MTTDTIRFSAVVPMYASAPYLPDLLTSFDEQVAGPYTVEYLFIDDGSPDEVATIAQDWLDRTGNDGRVIRQSNQGVSAARNAGIAAATGDWIALPDSDDFVGDRYFQAAARALLRFPDAVLVSSNVKRFDEPSGEKRNSHALRFKFADGTRMVDLDTSPQLIQSQAASAFFRRDLIVKNEIRFIEDLHVAEDALFVSQYLLRAGSRRAIMSAGSEYFYRKRAAGNSAVDTFKTNPDFYFGRFTRGYLPLFEEAAARGRVPAWLDMVLIYDLRWFFPREMTVHLKATAMSSDDKARVLDGVARVLAYVADESILTYRVTDLGVDYRCFFLALKGSPLPTHGVSKVVTTGGTRTEIRYLFAGEPPEEVFTRSNAVLTPVAHKIRTIDFFGQRVLFEKIVWLPGGSNIALTLNGRLMPLESGTYRLYEYQSGRAAPKRAPGSVLGRARTFARRLAGRGRAEIAGLVPVLFRHRQSAVERGRRIWIRRRAALSRRFDIGQKYAKAWVFMDKVHAAGDSAEYVYRSLRQSSPGTNAWFVLDEDSSDWPRLRAQGFRLVDYGSRQHIRLLRRADVVLSSHLDVEMTVPFPDQIYFHGKRPWKYVYLQHGVLQHDLSPWFRSKPIDIITTASVDEHASIVDDYTPYHLTSQQARLTGLARHDEVLRLAAQVDPADRNLLLIAPTWRHQLLAPKKSTGALREFKEPFEESEFARNWLSLVNSPELAAVAERAGVKIMFLPHPNFRTQIDPKLIAPHVEFETGSPDVQELVTRCRAVVTDYSSIFFEAAIAGADVSYFQFDRESFLQGGHTYIPGYWSYEEHGLGPVSLTSADAVEVLRRQLTPGAFDEERAFFNDRMQRTLPRLDGRAAERVIALTRSLLSGWRDGGPAGP